MIGTRGTNEHSLLASKWSNISSKDISNTSCITSTLNVVPIHLSPWRQIETVKGKKYFQTQQLYYLTCLFPYTLTGYYKLMKMHFIPPHRAPCLPVICGLVNLIHCVLLPVGRVLREQIGCSNSQSVTFPHPGCWPPYKERHYISLHNNTTPALRCR